MILDIHTHTGQGGRSAEHIITHHRYHGGEGSRSIILPIEPGDCTGALHDDGYRTELALQALETYGDEVIPFCNINPLASDALDQLRRFHDTGKCHGVGEYKVRLACDHPVSLEVYRLCGDWGWPVLIHFEYGKYSYNFKAFESVLKEFPQTTFIGHAPAWWANISSDARSDYTSDDYRGSAKGTIVPGGLTDRWLGQYPNLFGDVSAGSGNNVLMRDPEFARGFVDRHRGKLLFGSDCPCRDGKGKGYDRGCWAEKTLKALRDYCEDDDAFEDITHRNAERLLGL